MNPIERSNPALMQTPRLAFLAAVVLAPSLLSQSVIYQPNSTTPLEQLTGESFQIYSNGTYFYNYTLGRTTSASGLFGADLGYPVVYSDKVLFLFGDTLSTYTDSQGRFVLSSGSGGDDNISYIPNVDLSQCHYIGDVDSQLQSGVQSPNVSYGACPAMQTYLNPNAGPTDHKFQTTTIYGLTGNEATGPDETPSGAFDVNGTLYMFYIVQVQIPGIGPHFALESILARANEPTSAFSNASPPTFTKLSQVSFHPTITDPNNPPSEYNDYGKFMFDPVSVLDHATIASAGFLPGLPPALQAASKVVFVFGSSWEYNRSNLYLAAFDINNAAAGTSTWFYYAGQNGSNQWTSNESQATPLFPISSAPNIGNHSVLWNNTLRRFVLMWGNVQAAYSATPWGPWTNTTLIFDPNSGWGTKLIHRSPGSPIARTSPLVTIYKSDGTVANLNSGDTGFPYSPDQIDLPTVNSDGSVDIYYTMSTWNPYEAFLMKSTFTVGPLHSGPVVSGASYDSSAIAIGSIASIFGQGLADGIYPAPTAQLPNTLGGRQVEIQDSAGQSYFASLYFVAPGQINFVVPAAVAAGPAVVSVISGNSLVTSTTTTITPTAPALFSAKANGSGVASAFLVTIDASGKQSVQPAFHCASGSCAASPLDLSNAPNGAFLELYGTGIRNNGGTGSLGAAVGPANTPVVYAGPQSQYEGMDQVNLKIPTSLQGAGSVPVTLLIDGLPANTVTVTFQ